VYCISISALDIGCTFIIPSSHKKMNNKDYRYGTKKRRYLSKTIKSKKQKLKIFIKTKENPIIDHQVSTKVP